MPPEAPQGLWQLLLTWIIDHRLGDLASIVGLAVSLVGFLITIVGVFKSKGAAQRAEEAARETRESIRLLDTVVDFAGAIAILEEIKRMQRQRSWVLLPDRYATIRKLLISLRSSGQKLTDEQSAVIQSALANLRTIETQVERSLDNADTLKPAKLNALVSDDIDKLLTVLGELRAARVGG